MKLCQPLTLAAGLALALGLLTGTAQSDTKAPPAADKKTSGKKAAAPADAGYVNRKMSENWKNPDATLKRLSASMTEKVKGTDPEDVLKFVEKPANRLLLAQWMMAWYDRHQTYSEAIENSKKAAAGKHSNRDLDLQVQESILEDLGKDAKAEREEQKRVVEGIRRDLDMLEKHQELPWTLEEFAADKNSKRLLELLSSDLDWMYQVVFSGDCSNPGRVLAVMQGVAERYPDEFYKVRMIRDIATATGLEFARDCWEYGKAMDRADYYIRKWKERKLNIIFDSLPFWQLRICCGSKCSDGFGNASAGLPASFEWVQDNVRIPAERFSGCCWRCGYKLWNPYGQSVHGSDYRNPYNGLFDSNHHKFTYEVGGVCGGLSHFGAYAATAHGVPAFTMGEPGHCAFVLRINGEWTPAYSVFWQHSLHWTPWRGNYRYTTLHMMTELLEESDAKDNDVSYTYLALGRIFSDRNRKKEAVKCLFHAVNAQPLNLDAWLACAAYLKENYPADKELWRRLHDDVCTLMATRYPEVAADFLQRHVYDNLAKTSISQDEIKKCIHLFWSSLYDEGPARWEVGVMANRQMRLLVKDAEQPQVTVTVGEGDKKEEKKVDKLDADRACYLFASIYSAVSAKPVLPTRILDWMNELDAMHKNVMSDRIKKLTAYFSHIPTGPQGDAMQNKMLLAAEEMFNLDAFQSMGRDMADSKGLLDGEMPPHQPCNGTVMSQGGLVFAGSYGEGDTPAGHWGVLEGCGGNIETAAEANPWVGVMLARDAFVSGVVIIGPEDKAANRKDMVIQVSETGKDGSWQTVGSPLGECTGRISTADFSSSETKCKFIRVLRKGGNTPLQINAIYVYGRPAA